MIREIDKKLKGNQKKEEEDDDTADYSNSKEHTVRVSSVGRKEKSPKNFKKEERPNSKAKKTLHWTEMTLDDCEECQLAIKVLLHHNLMQKKPEILELMEMIKKAH